MKRAYSLTTRLALAFALVAGCAFGAVGTYLYRALAMQIVERDDAELMRKATRVRAELAEHHVAGNDRWRELSRIVSGNDEFALTVRGADGRVRVTANANAGTPPDFPSLAMAAPVDASAIHSWVGANGHTVRGIRLMARIPEVDTPMQVVVYQMAISRMALLRAYRWKLALATLLGALTAGGLGYAALRAGMAPLRRIAAGTHAITFSSADLAIDPAELPLELRELALALQQMIARLHEGYDRLSQFSMDLAHDFRTPIGNLLGQTQVTLSSDRSTEEYQALLASNVEEYERLARMIENMLFLARADNARVAMHCTTLDLADELARQADYFELLAEAREVTIRVDAHGKVFADPMLLRRAIGNLISNAVRYTPAGEAIVLVGREEGGQARIEVCNPGPGIAPDHLPRLFDRFFRGDPARANSGESSGIGLAIVKTIMDLHHGSVQAESTPGKVTRFRLEFPGRTPVGQV
ncbi:two-component system, OmpR family, heavy metal sensor histidine kinase CusS [Cupriavidus sp. YR651]|uniref:heavy metal sensor histidine kinase n=1 Tax=Cupriavidus sp. YR651 TaxID=1855315 RepID=UPI0008907F09|nr:heavy metal sensor histidine kinase [Cupriavidus sp. YR651]SDD37352.1 two-component system, OmpR family, heavy metal sensor histidine kinase CusS [Cupriavidus sp. YR651]